MVYIYCKVTTKTMDNNTKKEKNIVIFNLKFTTSKLLAYVVVILSTILAYLLNDGEIMVTGLIVGAALSGAKSVTDNLMKMKTKKIDDSSLINQDYESENNENNKVL